MATLADDFISLPAVYDILEFGEVQRHLYHAVSGRLETAVVTP